MLGQSLSFVCGQSFFRKRMMTLVAENQVFPVVGAVNVYNQRYSTYNTLFSHLTIHLPQEAAICNYGMKLTLSGF